MDLKNVFCAHTKTKPIINKLKMKRGGMDLIIVSQQNLANSPL